MDYNDLDEKDKQEVQDIIQNEVLPNYLFLLFDKVLITRINNEVWYRLNAIEKYRGLEYHFDYTINNTESLVIKTPEVSTGENLWTEN